jgi:hypothetical protein
VVVEMMMAMIAVTTMSVRTIVKGTVMVTITKMQINICIRQTQTHVVIVVKDQESSIT